MKTQLPPRACIPGHGVDLRDRARRSATRWSSCTRCSVSSTPEGLRSRGIEHFDGWAATFGEVVDTMEISPDGAGAPAPEPVRPLREPAGTGQQMFRAFADVQTAETLDLPRPRSSKGGKPHGSVACPMSEEQNGPPGRRWSSPLRPLDPTRRRWTPGRTTPWRSRPTAASSPWTPAYCSGRGRRLRGLEGQRPRRERRVRIWRRDGHDASRHADDLLRHGGKPDPMGVFGL